jgi:hypothetical protein
MAPTLIMLLLILPAAPLAACAGAGAPLGSVDNLSCHSPVVSASRHRSVIFFICRVASLVGGPSGSNEKQPIMKNGLSYLARGVLLTGTFIAYAQTHGPTAVAQSPATAPPSGVLVTQPPAPVAVPPSGVLVTPPTAERRAVATELVKTGQKERTPAKSAPSTMRHRVVHLRSAGHRRTVTRTVPVDQSIAAAPSGVSTAAAQPRIDEIGYEAFLTQIGKAKQAK